MNPELYTDNISHKQHATEVLASLSFLFKDPKNGTGLFRSDLIVSTLFLLFTSPWCCWCLWCASLPALLWPGTRWHNCIVACRSKSLFLLFLPLLMFVMLKIEHSFTLWANGHLTMGVIKSAQWSGMRFKFIGQQKDWAFTFHKWGCRVNDYVASVLEMESKNHLGLWQGQADGEEGIQGVISTVHIWDSSPTDKGSWTACSPQRRLASHSCLRCQYCSWWIFNNCTNLTVFLVVDHLLVNIHASRLSLVSNSSIGLIIFHTIYNV